MTVSCDNIPTSGPNLNYSNNANGICLIDGSVTPVESGSANICGGTITYTWDFTDQCGNSINHVQNVTVDPTPKPEYINAPLDITVSCDNIPTGAPDLTYTNNNPGACLIEGTVPPVQSGSGNICGGTITFQWSDTSPCGDPILHTQIITITPAPAPVFQNPPQDITVSCDNIPTSAAPLNYTNNAQGACLIQGQVTPTQSGSANICGGSITYTWQFTDQCGNSISHIQTITVSPAPPVAFVNPPPDFNVSCDNVPQNPTPLQYTNNGPGSCLIQGSVAPTTSGAYDACGGAIIYTWGVYEHMRANNYPYSKCDC